jgi:hypothetical protein
MLPFGVLLRLPGAKLGKSYCRSAQRVRIRDMEITWSRNRRGHREGLENAPRALIGLLRGENFGKLLGARCALDLGRAAAWAKAKLKRRTWAEHRHPGLTSIGAIGLFQDQN